MKKIAAFFTALIMAGITILGMHVYSSGKTEFHSPDFGFWTAGAEVSGSGSGQEQPENENSLVIMASSELEHGKWKRRTIPKICSKAMYFSRC